MGTENRLKEFRTNQGLAMKGLSKLSGISTATIVACEVHSIIPTRLSTRQKLADALQVDVKVLFPDT